MTPAILMVSVGEWNENNSSGKGCKVMVTVKQMRDALKKMPPDAPLFIEVDAYYHEGERNDKDAVDLPSLSKDGTVSIGSVFARP